MIYFDPSSINIIRINTQLTSGSGLDPARSDPVKFGSNPEQQNHDWEKVDSEAIYRYLLQVKQFLMMQWLL